MRLENVVIQELDWSAQGVDQVRIDWIGALHRNPNCPTEPFIEVIASPVSAGGQVRFRDRRSGLIGIGQWPALRMGAIFERGRHSTKMAPFGEVQELSVEVPPIEKVSMVSFSDVGKQGIMSRDDYGVSIPDRNYTPGHGGFGANCFLLSEEKGAKQLVLPVAEAIRFYYAHTTDLSKIAVFNGYKYDLERIINPRNSRFDPVDRRCVLHLRKMLADGEAWTIGRVLHSAPAFAGVSMIHNSLVALVNRGWTTFPKCGLPFAGKASWKVRGIPVGPEKKNFLILEILRCSASFPYEKLEVSRDNDARTRANPEEPDHPIYLAKKARIPNGTSPTIQSTLPPAGDVIAEQIEFEAGVFAAIEGKEIIRNEKMTPEEKVQGKTELRIVEVLQMSTADGFGDGEGKTFMGKIVGDEPKRHGHGGGMPADVDRHPEIVEELRKLGIQADRCGNCALNLPASSPKKRAWERHANGLLRRVGVIEMCIDGRWFYFLEIQDEPRKNCAARVFTQANGAELLRQQFNQIFWALVKEEGVWREGMVSEVNLRCEGMSHSWKSLGMCAKNIVREKIVELMGHGKSVVI